MRKFTIREKRHYCNYWWTKIFFPRYGYRKWEGKIKLSRECWWYPPRDENDLIDVNKICGVGFGFNHHKNSWRLGFIPKFDSVNVFEVYCYFYDSISKEHKSEKIGNIEADREYLFEVVSNDMEYHVCIIGVGNVVFDNISKDSKLQFTLYPYMGGDNTAIRDMYIYVELKYIK